MDLVHGVSRWKINLGIPYLLPFCKSVPEIAVNQLAVPVRLEKVQQGPSVSKTYLQIGPKPLQTLQNSTKPLKNPQTSQEPLSFTPRPFNHSKKIKELP
jgi:hypothetical protein